MHEDDDFEPLRIRPYVNLPDPEPDEADDVVGAAYETQPLVPVREEVRPPEFPASPPARPRRRRPLALLAVGTAALAVIGTAAFAGGLFSGDGDGSSDALPIAPTTAPAPDGTAAPPQPSASAHSPSPTPKPSRPTPSPTRSKERPPTPTPSLSTARATGTVRTPSPTPTPDAPSTAPAAPVLRKGDDGPEVTELQKRLQQAWVYQGPTTGHFNEQVEDAVREYQSWMSIQGDPSGVYGPQTRKTLEASTQEP
ncbi:peptidoglycan-binding protein [Streptomyces sp. NPDC050738]|uniref:peptidoglycan-binding protein n=1 Tax=Streptomyces sp. NPDC050738 TaxID=3154744 RepID=UPI00341AE2BB